MSDSIKTIVIGQKIEGTEERQEINWQQVKDYALGLNEAQLAEPVVLWHDELSGSLSSINEAAEDLINPSGDGVEARSEYEGDFTKEDLDAEAVVYAKGHPILEVFFSGIETLRELAFDKTSNNYRLIYAGSWSRNIDIKVGSALDHIIKEREHQKQIGYDVAHDKKVNFDNSLANAAAAILRLHADKDNIGEFPGDWSDEACRKITRKDRREQLVISAALILAMIEMFDEIELHKNGSNQIKENEG